MDWEKTATSAATAAARQRIPFISPINKLENGRCLTVFRSSAALNKVSRVQVDLLVYRGVVESSAASPG